MSVTDARTINGQVSVKMKGAKYNEGVRTLSVRCNEVAITRRWSEERQEDVVRMKDMMRVTKYCL